MSKLLPEIIAYDPEFLDVANKDIIPSDQQEVAETTTPSDIKLKNHKDKRTQ